MRRNSVSRENGKRARTVEDIADDFKIKENYELDAGLSVHFQASRLTIRNHEGGCHGTIKIPLPSSGRRIVSPSSRFCVTFGLMTLLWLHRNPTTGSRAQRTAFEIVFCAGTGSGSGPTACGGSPWTGT